MVPASHPRTIVGGIPRTRQTGLEHRQSLPRLPQRETPTPCRRETRGGPHQIPARRGPRTRTRRGADLPAASRREPRLPGDRRTAQHRPRPLPAPATQQRQTRPGPLVGVLGPRDPDQPQIHRLHGVEPARQQERRRARPAREMGVVTRAHPRTPGHPRGVGRGAKQQDHPPGVADEREEHPPRHLPHLRAALVRPPPAVQQEDVRQNPQGLRLLHLPTQTRPRRQTRGIRRPPPLGVRARRQAPRLRRDVLQRTRLRSRPRDPAAPSTTRAVLEQGPRPRAAGRRDPQDPHRHRPTTGQPARRAGIPPHHRRRRAVRRLGRTVASPLHRTRTATPHQKRRAGDPA
ncbi:Uncharacterised protein [Nocardia asteroides]|nr:hypothetical protein SAMN05444423_104178 [Nocardia asteroides]VEG33946.1 Uncharacterised protein [Nocardia asteroides]